MLPNFLPHERNVCGGTTNNYKSMPKKFGGKHRHKNLLEIFL
jgi:hypothetical protein